MQTKILSFLLLGCATVYSQNISFDLNTILQKQDSIQYLPYGQLFESYKSRDVTMGKLAIQVEKAKTALAQSRLKNGVDISVSTGEMTATISKDETTFSLNPSATVSIPQANNMKITGSVPVNTDVADNETVATISGSAVNLSAEIISKTHKQLQIQDEMAVRNLVETERNYQKQEITLEKNFLNEVSTLYSYALALLIAENALYDAKLEFDTAKTQGFSPISATYRSKMVKVQSAQNEVEDKKRQFTSELNTFATKAGFSVSVMPENIPQKDLILFDAFLKDDFMQLESSRWTLYLAQQNKTARSDFTLTGNTGYQYKDKSNLGANIGSEHHVQAGLSAQYKGISVGAAVSVPVNKPDKISTSLSLGWDFQNSFSGKLEDKNLTLSVENEKLSIVDALEQYSIIQKERQQTRENLIWKVSVQKEQIQIFKDYLQEATDWYNRGLISETQFNQAQRDYTNASLTLIVNELSCLIYNLETQSYFIVK